MKKETEKRLVVFLNWLKSSLNRGPSIGMHRFAVNNATSLLSEIEGVENLCDCKKCRAVRAESRLDLYRDECPYDEGTDSQAEWLDGICEPMFEVVRGSYKLEDCGLDNDVRLNNTY